MRQGPSSYLPTGSSRAQCTRSRGCGWEGAWVGPRSPLALYQRFLCLLWSWGVCGKGRTSLKAKGNQTPGSHLTPAAPTCAGSILKHTPTSAHSCRCSGVWITPTISSPFASPGGGAWGCDVVAPPWKGSDTHARAHTRRMRELKHLHLTYNPSP